MLKISQRTHKKQLSTTFSLWKTLYLSYVNSLTNSLLNSAHESNKTLNIQKSTASGTLSDLTKGSSNLTHSLTSSTHLKLSTTLHRCLFNSKKHSFRIWKSLSHNFTVKKSSLTHLILKKHKCILNFSLSKFKLSLHLPVNEQLHSQLQGEIIQNSQLSLTLKGNTEGNLR